MQWKNLLADLKSRGWTQVQIAARVGVSQSTISELSRGEVKDPSYGLGRALEDLHASGELPAAEAKAA